MDRLSHALTEMVWIKTLLEKEAKPFCETGVRLMRQSKLVLTAYPIV